MPIYAHKLEPEAFVYVDEVEYGVTDVEAQTDADEPNHPPLAHLSFNGHMLLLDMEELSEVRDLIALLEGQLAATLKDLGLEDDGEEQVNLH